MWNMYYLCGQQVYGFILFSRASRKVNSWWGPQGLYQVSIFTARVTWKRQTWHAYHSGYLFSTKNGWSFSRRCIFWRPWSVSRQWTLKAGTSCVGCPTQRQTPTQGSISKSHRIFYHKEHIVFSHLQAGYPEAVPDKANGNPQAVQTARKTRIEKHPLSSRRRNQRA